MGDDCLSLSSSRMHWGASEGSATAAPTRLLTLPRGIAAGCPHPRVKSISDLLSKVVWEWGSGLSILLKLPCSHSFYSSIISNNSMLRTYDTCYAVVYNVGHKFLFHWYKEACAERCGVFCSLERNDSDLKSEAMLWWEELCFATFVRGKETMSTSDLMLPAPVNPSGCITSDLLRIRGVVCPSSGSLGNWPVNMGLGPQCQLCENLQWQLRLYL